jgi:general secretion pathway protein L
MTRPLVLLPLPADLSTPPVAQWAWAGVDGATQLGRVTAIVPAQALSWHRVQLPAGVLRQGPRLRAVLEGLLEDQLLDDPAQMHFALQPFPAAGPVWVAACARGWLRQALLALEHAGHQLDAVVPEWAPQAGAATLWVTGDAATAQAVWVDGEGVHLRPLSADHTSSASIPESWQPLVVQAEPAVAALAEALHRGEVSVLSRDERLRECANSPWDLAQGDMARRHPLARRLQQTATALWQAPQWRPARWALVALLLVHFVGLNAAAWHARSQLAQQRSAMQSTLLATFPNTPVVVDAPKQMEQGVASLRQASGTASARDLESVLAAIGSLENFEARPPATSAPTAIDFVAGEVRIRGLALSAAQLPALQSQLQTRGYSARLDGDTLQLTPRGTP